MIAKRMCVALAAVLVLAGGAASGADEDDDRNWDEVQAQIAALQDEVARLKAANDEGWLTQQRADEVRALVQDVLADADTRASLMQDGMTAGWDDGFFLASADGNWRLNIHGLLQSRFAWNNQDTSPSGDDDRWGFEIPRAKLWFDGNIVNPNWIYKIEVNAFEADDGSGFGSAGGDLVLEDAYLGYVFDDTGFVFLAGQFKVPMLREELVFSANQTFVERSLVNEEFTAGRTQGAALDFRNDQFHVIGGYTDGHPATGGYNMPALSADTEISLTARAEWLVAGDWSQFDDLAGWPGQDYGVMIGAAVHWQKGESGTSGVPNVEVLQWTVDVSVEGDRWNLFTYFVGRHIDDATGLVPGGSDSYDQYGLVVQGGYFVTDDWEIFGRWEWGDDDNVLAPISAGTSTDDLSIITIGATRYFQGNQLRWTTDLGVGLDGVSPGFGGGFLGTGGGIADWRTDARGQDGQFVLRTQMQLMF